MEKLLNNLEKGGWELSRVHLLYLLISAQSHRGIDTIPAYTNGGEAGHQSIIGLTPGKHIYTGNFNVPVQQICMFLDCGGKPEQETERRGEGIHREQKIIP